MINEELTSELTNILLEKKKLETREKEIKKKIQNLMEETNESKYEDELMKISYIPESTSMTFDTKAFKKENPKAYDMFLKETTRSAYLKVSVK